MSAWRDLGHGHRIQLTRPDSNGVRHFVDEHRRPDTRLGCSGAGRILDPGQERPPPLYSANALCSPGLPTAVT